MSKYVTKKAKKLFENGQVVLTATTDTTMYFKIKDYSVTFNKYTWVFSCTCIHASIWSANNPDEFCYHICAVKEYLKSLETLGERPPGCNSGTLTPPLLPMPNNQEVKE